MNSVMRLEPDLERNLDSGGSAALRSAWWMPLAFVAFVLVALTATPVVVSHRVRKLRDQLTDGSDAGRVVVNDFEVAFSRQLLVEERTRGTAERDVHHEAINADAIARERTDEIALDSIARRLGADAVERFVELRTKAGAWHDYLATMTSTASRSLSTSPSTQGDQAVLDARAEDVLSSAQALDNYLRMLSLQQRARIQELARINLISAVILAPLALAAALALYWTGRRTLFFANAAERDRAALAHAMTLKATLVRGLTHDLKNPLGAAYGYAELLEDEVVGPVAPSQREMLARIKGLVTLSVTTVDDLIELYRDGSDGLQIHLVPTDVVPIVKDVVADFQAEAMQSQLQLEVALDAMLHTGDGPASRCDSLYSRTDPAKVRQILGNLVSNAIKYTPAGGHVWLSTRQASDPEPRIAIDVRDTGPGIPPNEQERIFEEFFRLPSTMEIAGTGVGLAISRRFARMLGGELTVTDWFEGGSVFTLWLPAWTDTTGATSGAASRGSLTA
jgi:signal transduction histidine kinase